MFEKFTLLLESSKKDKELYKKLHSEKIVFFLHLLGLDTNGHSHLPTSEFYLNNIRIVDDGIKKVTEQLREFYGDDGKTAYVFTADHGMGNRGKDQASVNTRAGKMMSLGLLFIHCLCFWHIQVRTETAIPTTREHPSLLGEQESKALTRSISKVTTNSRQTGGWMSTAGTMSGRRILPLSWYVQMAYSIWGL